ncbi:nuclear factor NF-kappa-B p105 subunit-like [Babylonia areolata]|uniref:nuclear factor NF-kappa-B p105 subunit-like n=1 Tax=Babylonia areolata TaxID=304850 RepID=UPI003FD1C4C5
MEPTSVLQLWRACYAGNTDLVQDLIEDDVDFCHRDRNGETVLHMAARSDNSDVLNLLLDHLSPDVQNHNDQTPLHLAATKGHLSIVNVLLEAHCQLGQKTKYSGMTALHLACQHGQTPVVAALLDGGAACNVTDSIGKPPEFYATDPGIHQLFRTHTKHCTHHDDTAPHPQSSDDNGEEEEEEEEEEKPEKAVKKKRSGQQTTPLETQNMWKKAGGRAGKKVKVNHGLGFSEEHKQRMEMNVFDRLMGSKKK